MLLAEERDCRHSWIPVVSLLRPQFSRQCRAADTDGPARAIELPEAANRLRSTRERVQSRDLPQQIEAAFTAHETP